ncbi:hypothetical protein I5Q34_10980 [Streptomyces sp. AV19]|uniref:hypothetical protein n=1 Tax=Streptomyces sp. AV19 TaxID=2793068 RepID=UPI0018FE223E|nr:hypothetical protein [Streptomyces sp. AV19]MBH1934795.1 hypothetical protein [Streptomyces sp. AV19]MDG4530600.1 hypothetical protein [Streptomyces sp. AV19]
MANPHQYQPEGNQDPAGSTQMFRAFVDEGATGRQAAAPSSRGRRSPGPRVGLIVGVLVAIVVVATVAWLAIA